MDIDIRLKKYFMTIDPITFQPFLNLDLAFPLALANPDADRDEEETARQLGAAMIELMKEHAEKIETDVNKGP